MYIIPIFWRFWRFTSPHPDEKHIGIRKAWKIAGIISKFRGSYPQTQGDSEK